jgi:hypothetical protein
MDFLNKFFALAQKFFSTAPISKSPPCPLVKMAEGLLKDAKSLEHADPKDDKIIRKKIAMTAKKIGGEAMGLDAVIPGYALAVSVSMGRSEFNNSNPQF